MSDYSGKTIQALTKIQEQAGNNAFRPVMIGYLLGFIGVLVGSLALTQGNWVAMIVLFLIGHSMLLLLCMIVYCGEKEKEVNAMIREKFMLIDN